MFPQRELVETDAGAKPAGTMPFVLLASYRKVKSISRYLVSGAPTRCAYCTQPFPSQDEHLQCWHGADHRYYCSEECSTRRRGCTRKAA